MPVRKTEKQIPVIPGFIIDDLGQHAASATNAQVKIISYLTSPLRINILQNYVVFVEDAALQPNVSSYEWTFNNNGTITNANTTDGVTSFTPTLPGALSVTVNLKDNTNTTLNTVSLQQQVAERNLELEQLIDQESNSIPAAANPDISREVINGLRIYADASANPSTDNALNRLILSLLFSALSQNNAAQRNTLLENCSAALETNPPTFFDTAQDGIGVSKMRPHLASMFILDGGVPLIPLTEIPAGANTTRRNATIAAIKTAFNGLTEARRIDIFNLLRFPKSNIKICKLVLDGLKAKYFSAETFAIVLGNRNKARRLIMEYRVGPYVPPAGSATSDLQAISTTIFNLMLLPVWRISVSALTNPAGTIDPQTRLFGIPEPIPEKTYLADVGIFPNDGPFILAGRLYHQNFNINFTTVRSMHEIIDDLQANSTIFNHFRIFTHANENLLGISMFRNGGGSVQFEHLHGFSTSELRGVLGIWSLVFTGGRAVSMDIADLFLTRLRTINSPSLNPFNLQTGGDPLSTDLREVFRRYIDLWYINIAGSIQVQTGAVVRNITQAEMDDPFGTYTDLIVRLLKPPIITAHPALTDADFTALRTAIIGRTPVEVGLTGPPAPISPPFRDNPFPDNFFTSIVNDLKSTVAALPAGNTFMARLTHVKNNRFDGTSFVDIRGCLAGRLPAGVAGSPPFLLELQNFFGIFGSLPSVNAPEWFQTFNSSFRNEPLANNAAIDTLFNTGYNTGGVALTTAEISRDFNTWSQLSNLDDQFLFFSSLFVAGANLVDFASLRWRTWRLTGAVNGIPPLHLHATRADDMVQLSLGDLINRLRVNFSASGANLAVAVVTRLNSLQPKIEDLLRIEDQLTAFAGVDFTSFFNNLTALAPQILTIPGMPAPGTPLIDAAMPALLDRAVTTGYIANFKTYLTNQLNTDIGVIFSNITTAIGAANAKRHYYFNIRLPLRVQTATGNNVNYVVFYIAGAASDAIKSYMKCQWTGTASQIADMHNFIDGLTINDGNGFTFVRTAALTETDTSSIPNAVAPLPDYDSHIIKV